MSCGVLVNPLCVRADAAPVAIQAFHVRRRDPCEALVRWMELVEVGEHRVVARIAASVCLSVQAEKRGRSRGEN